jgi:hypothetical protein
MDMRMGGSIRSVKTNLRRGKIIPTFGVASKRKFLVTNQIALHPANCLLVVVKSL